MLWFQPVPDQEKDEKYWKQRAKNTASTRRSREVKRTRANEQIEKIKFLELENPQISEALKKTKEENEILKQELEFRKALFSQYSGI